MRSLILAAGLVAAAANADSTNNIDNPNNNPIEYITVTASRTPLEISESGSSLSIITREQVEQRGSPSVAELLREIPGFAVSQQGSRGAVTQVRVRGSEANQVLVLIDGIEANDLSQGSEFNFAHVTPGQIQRIEIVRGPQSALWGSDALAGVVNIVTIPRTGDRNKLSGSLEAGSFNSQRANVQWQHVTDESRWAIGVDYFDTEGTNISRTGSEEDGYDNITVNVAGEQALADNWRVNLSVRKTDATTEFDGVDFVTTGLPTDAELHTDSKQLYAGATINYVAEWADHSVGVHRTDTVNTNDSNAAVDDRNEGIKDKLFYQANFRFDQHILTAIAEYEEEEYKQRGVATAFGDPNKNLETDTRSLAAEYRYNGDRLDLSLSTRHDNNADFDNAVSWRATANWQLPVDRLSLFASVGESIKNPTFTERFGFFDTFVGNPDLIPEESLSKELGMRYQLDRGFLTVSLYQADLQSEINGFVFDAARGAFTAENIDGESDRQGLELGYQQQLSDGFNLDASYTYLDASQEDATGANIVEVRRPEHSASVNLNYAFGKTNFNLGMIYTGEQEDDYFPPFPPFQERVDLDAYTLVNLAIQYRWNENLAMTLRAVNLTDEDYEEVYGFEAPGRGVYGGIRVSF